jgi:molybdate transport system ATP-binding protein
VVELELEIEVPLDAFSLKVALNSEARVLGVFGPSGAGKSTLLEALAGTRTDVRGKIRLGQESWLDTEKDVFMPPEARSVGWVPQDAILFSHLDVRGNLSAGAAARKRQPSESEVQKVARQLGIEALLARSIATLSGGERQRVALGRALLSSPRLLLLDEPFAALDLPRRRSLVPLLQEICQAASIPVLFVSHDPVEMNALADRVIALDAGALVPFTDAPSPP